MNEPAAPPKQPRARRVALIVAGLVGLIAILGGAVAVGYWGGQHQAAEKINARFVQPFFARFNTAPPPEQESVTWETLNTHFFALHVARINVSPGGMPAIWTLNEMGGNILFATRLGSFGYLDANYRLHRLEGLQVDMGLEELRQSPLFEDPVFQLSELRTLDMLSIETGPGAYDLYVSHHRYRNGCFEVVVSRAHLTADETGVRAASPNWDDIYVMSPCIPVKDVGMRFAGHEGGGRLARLNANTLLLSIGVHQFDGITGPFQAGQDDANDLGKIIEISLRDNSHRTYARGFRNPQGLLVASDGRVWESEHGPRGGDEVNLIRRGANYGWPIVTYGTEYGAIPWPFDPHPGQHIGFERPRFSFVPSIGISNLVEPSATEFPEWREHILAASLNGSTLYALKTEGDDITYAEPIPMGERMRDMIAMQDGRIAIVTDSGQIILVRNGARHEDAPNTFIVAGLSERPQPAPEETAPVTPEILGARIFHYNCGSCHSVTGQTLAGPPLNGVFGRDIGSVEGFPYSPTLLNAPGEWTPSRLRSFLSKQDPRTADAAMPQVNLYKDQFEGLVEFLRANENAPETPQN